MRTHVQFKGTGATEVQGLVVAELPLTIHVNRERLVTMLCSPFQVDALAVGYLWTEGIIERVDEIRRLDVSVVDGRADIELASPLRPGAGRANGLRPLCSTVRVTPDVLSARMAELAEASLHYKQSRGIHAAALCDSERLLLVAEDVSRRNALDKLKDQALREGVATADRILVSSGRISSEMLLRAARMRTPVVASRTSPTDMAIALAEELNVTVCGYVRPDGLNLYAGAGVVLAKTPAAECAARSSS
jgi:FdhD protein